MHKSVYSVLLYCKSATSTVPLSHEFKLGLGPCGKVVTDLSVAAQEQGVSVLQFTECGECKEFYYPYSQLVSRITTTHKESSQ
uniref:Uncharacterized protein n=1 Tax=Aeromonas phage vB_AdhaP_MF TaxID=3367373 RepID=A0AB74UP87_9CAUD